MSTPAPASPRVVTTTALLAGLSHALDLTEGHPQGHAERSCALGLAIAGRMKLSERDRADLVHAMLLKDAGCSSNAARVYQLFGGPEHGVKRAVWERDWRRYGDQLAYALGWVERGGSPVARFRRFVAARAGRWFDPELARAALSLDDGHPVWRELADEELTARLVEGLPDQQSLVCTPERVDRISEAFALIIDGKSPYTFSHSDRVARYAVDIGRRLGQDADFLVRLRRAALVHDLGKLTVPNSILDSSRALTSEEWAVVRRHPAHTFEILERVPVLSGLALDAASHHERLDGNGYHTGAGGADLSLTARILAVADVTDALAADRPYRAAMAPDEVVSTLKGDRGTHFCPACVDVCTPDLVGDSSPRPGPS